MREPFTTTSSEMAAMLAEDGWLVYEHAQRTPAGGDRMVWLCKPSSRPEEESTETTVATPLAVVSVPTTTPIVCGRCDLTFTDLLELGDHRQEHIVVERRQKAVERAEAAERSRRRREERAAKERAPEPVRRGFPEVGRIAPIPFDPEATRLAAGEAV